MNNWIKKWPGSWVVTACLIGATIGSPIAAAQDYPSKAIRMVVPYAAGGGIDAIARLVAQGMSEELKQTIVIENKGGAGGMIGTEFVTKAKPDGYTLLLAGNPELTVNPILVHDARYDAAQDLIPIILISESPNVIAAHRDVKGSLKEIVTSAVKGQALNVGSPGTGSTQHMALEILKAVTGADLVHVPYKGAAPAISDAIGGQIQLVVSGLPPLIAQFKAGKLRPLAVTLENRSPLAKNIPTVGEALGPVGEAVVARTWYGILAPAGTKVKNIETIRNAAMKVLTKQDVKSRLAEMGTEIVALSGPAFEQRIADELKINREIITRFHIKAQ